MSALRWYSWQDSLPSANQAISSSRRWPSLAFATMTVSICFCALNARPAMARA